MMEKNLGKQTWLSLDSACVRASFLYVKLDIFGNSIKKEKLKENIDFLYSQKTIVSTKRLSSSFEPGTTNFVPQLQFLPIKRYPFIYINLNSTKKEMQAQLVALEEQIEDIALGFFVYAIS